MDLPAKSVAAHKSLTIQDVRDLAKSLMEMSDMYPLQFRTERDFFPLVRAFLDGRVPSITAEVGDSNKKIDFRIGGTNPALLELAVCPRALIDPDCETAAFPGRSQATQLYASANCTEIEKLSKVPQPQAKNRYLLLVDFRGAHNVSRLESGYLNRFPRDGTMQPVRVIYISRSRARDFQVGGKPKGPVPKKKSA